MGKEKKRCKDPYFVIFTVRNYVKQKYIHFMNPNAHLSTIYNRQHRSNPDVHGQINGSRSCGTYIQWNITRP